MATWPLGALVVVQTYAVHREIERQFAKVIQPVDPTAAKKSARPSGGRQTRPAALDQPTDCRFVKTPLGEVASFFAKRHGTGVTLDEEALREAGIAFDAPVTAEVRGVSLAAALNLVLSQVGLTWTADAKGLRITTPQAAERAMVLVTYDLRGLVPAGNAADLQNLIDILQMTVDPRTWEDNGGPGTSLALPATSAIQVRQTYQVHRKIEQLLAELRRAGKA